MTDRETSTSSTPFDALADGYDEAFTDSPLGKLLRAAVWRRIEPYVRRGGTALDLGCGTGEDAVHLAGVGMTVVAVDASQRMVEIATHRCRQVTGAVRVEIGDLARLDSVPNSTGPFDLVLSDFGALNCVEDLADALASIAARLSDDGTLVAVIMGRVVPWEWLWSLVSGRPRSAFRRLRAGGVEWRGMRIRYYTPGDVRRAARSANLVVRRMAGLGALLPVTQAGPWISRHRRLMAALEGLERRFETTRPLPSFADHLLVELGQP